MPPTAEELEAQRKADEEKAKREGAESEEESSEEEELTVEQLQARLAEQQKHIKALNKESADRRKKLEEFEKQEQDRKQAELTEAEKVKQRADQLEQEKLALAKENQTLKRQRDFEGLVRDAGLQFKNSLAAKDAFKAIVEMLEDGETEVTEDHIKQLVKERDYYFGKPDPNQVNTDGSKKGKSNPTVTTQDAIAAKRKLISPI